MKKKLTTVLPTVSLAVVNPALTLLVPTTVYSGTITTLNVALNNQTGANITVPAGAKLMMYMPSYFTATEIGAMKITTTAAGWAFTYNAGENALVLTYSGTSATWASAAALTFAIENVKGAATTGSDTLQVNFNGLQGTAIPSQVSATLVMSTVPLPSRVNLTDVLLVNTEYGGQIYVSTTIDPLTNSLYLDLKNTGANPLYNSAVPRTGNPTVTVSFVYGSTSGALAPADKSGASQKGSAWSISGAVAVDQTGGWRVDNPNVTSSANSPSWILKPTTTNTKIIGIGENANVSFVFSNIFSFTPTGPTQMYVHFSGFTRDENSVYNDHTFVVPILKSNAPPIRGILNFFGPPLLYIKQQQDVPVGLEWTGYQMASVSMVCNAVPSPTPSPYVKAYPDPVPLIYDGTTVKLPSVKPDTSVMFTLAALDGHGTQLNAAQFLVTIVQKPGVYTFGGPSGNVSFTMNKPAPVELNWRVYRAASIVIKQGSTKLLEKTYDASSLWNIESTSVSATIAGANSTEEFTINAYDAKGNLQETMTCKVTFVANAWCDPKDSKVYPLVRVNNQVWLGSNYDYNDPKGGSYFYNNNSVYESQYGRLYLYESAMRNVPAGWRLPYNSDWKALIISQGANPIAALLPGGSSHLNMQLGGAHYSGGIGFDNMATTAMYWGMPFFYPGFMNFFMIIWEGDSKSFVHGDLPYPLPDGSLDSCALRFILKDPQEEAPSRKQEPEPFSASDRAKILPWLLRGDDGI